MEAPRRNTAECRLFQCLCLKRMEENFRELGLPGGADQLCDEIEAILCGVEPHETMLNMIDIWYATVCDEELHPEFEHNRFWRTT
jgi:hypothetical protein